MAKTRIICVVIALFVYTQSQAYQETKLLASDGLENDYFGRSVAIDGETIAVGAYSADNNGENSGTVYVYTRNGSNWMETELPVVAEGPLEGDACGYSVAIDGDTLVAGAPYGNAVYIYTFNGTSWIFLQKIVGSGRFGHAVDLDGDTMVIGASEGLGKAYVYTWNDVAWESFQELQAPVPDPLPDLNDSPHYGAAVKIDDDTMVIGAYQYSYNQVTYTGAAWVYIYNGTNWQLQADLAGLAGGELQHGGFFGDSVDIEDNTILVGAYRDNGISSADGSVYIFERSGTTWSKQQHLWSSNPDAWYFGCAVSLLEDRAIIGADYAHFEDGREGCAFEYRNTNGVWVEEALIAGSDSASEDWFGIDVVQTENFVVVGAHKNNEKAADAGAVYIYTVCNYDLVGDLNDDCRVDILDLADMAANWLIDCFEEPTNPACTPMQ